MNLPNEKKILIDWISNLEDESIIEELSLLKENLTNNKDWWDELNVEQRKSILRGLKDVEEGKVFSYEQVKELVKKWLMKSNSQVNQ